MKESKDQLKMKIQKLFSRIRDEINKREDQLLLDVDNQYNSLFFKEDLIKKSQKLPNMIKISLEKGKIKEEDWKDEDKLSCLINNCISIEKNIKDLEDINDKIKECNSKKDYIVELSPEENEINDFLNIIKNFGNIYYYDKIENKRENQIIHNNEKIEENNRLNYDENIDEINMISYNENIEESKRQDSDEYNIMRKK